MQKISIIVPIYNVSSQLPRCLKSLKLQTFKELEIILVDDGSPDDCGEICDRFAADDPRFHVLHKTNEGVARARNDGLKLATGEYIAFADSDDWYRKDALSLLYSLLQKTGADYAVGGCQKVYEMEDGSLKVRREKELPAEETVKNSDEVLKNILTGGSAIWNRLFRREVLEGLSFPVGRINDDEVMALHAAARCDRIAFTTEKTYYYRIRKNSITTSAFSLRNMDVYRNAKENLEFIQAERPALSRYAEYKLIKTLLYCRLHLMKLPRSTERDEALAEVKAVLREEDLRLLFRRSNYERRSGL